VEVTPVSDEQNRLFTAVDALLEQAAAPDVLPAPAERKRLREAASLSQEQIAQALNVRRETVTGWESGRTEPRPRKRAAYIRLLDGLADRFPAPQSFAAPAPHSVPAPSTAAQAEAPAQIAAPRPRSATSGHSSAAPRRPRTTKAAARETTAPAVVDERFINGPLAVVDGDGSAYCVGGLVLDCPLTDLPALVEWTLREAKLGAPRLHRSGKDADPLIVLTASAAQRLGLPPVLEDRRGLRLPDDHPALRQLAAAKWKLTKRGFGPWARVYRTAEGTRRHCVQFAILPWDALDTRAWGPADQLEPAELARLLGIYATRVHTPRGSTAVTGLELMTALRPPTRAVKDPSTGGWVSGPVPGSLTEPVECAPPEAPDGHPAVAALYPRFHQRTPDQVLNEEAYQWARPLTDAECTKPYVVGIDVNMAFAAAANRLTVGLSAPSTSTTRPSIRSCPARGWSTCPTSPSMNACPIPSPPTASARRGRPGTPALAEYLIHADGGGFGCRSGCPSRRSRTVGGGRGMMIGRAAETGVPGYDEHVRDAAAAADERPREGCRNPGPAPSDCGPGAAVERAAGPVPRERPGVPGHVAPGPAAGGPASDATAGAAGHAAALAP
jgi:DNA-binding transcriptional regulator YiaG